MLKCITGIFIVFTVAIVACMHEPVPAPVSGNNTPGKKDSLSLCHPDSIYFTNTILPLLTSNCGVPGCHDQVTQTKGIDVTSYNALMDAGIIRTDHPDKSKLYEMITATDPDKLMPQPPRPALTIGQKDLILKWISQGALNNACRAGCDTAKYGFAADIKPMIDGYCKGCHSGTGAPLGINLETHSGIRDAVNGGRFMGAIKHEAGFSAMPKNTTKWNDCYITSIRKWIDSGMPDN